LSALLYELTTALTFENASKGYKHGAAVPPEVETLLKWVGKNDRLDLAQLVQKVNRLKAAMLRFKLHGNKVFNVNVNHLPMATKERMKRAEMFAHNREMKKLAIEGEHQIVIDGLDEAKLRRRSIAEKALKRAELLQANQWAQIEFPSKSVKAALQWFEETAHKRVLGQLEEQTLAQSQAPGTSGTAPANFSRVPSSAEWGPMDANRIYAAPELMISTVHVPSLLVLAH
jgi:hypothetical protein